MGTAFEKLAAANAAGKHLCVGLDPDPAHIRALTGEDACADLVYDYASTIVSATGAYAAAFKPNLSFWMPREEVPDIGPHILRSLIIDIHEEFPHITVILDDKKGDIANTAKQSAATAKWLEADAVTVSPYMGIGDVTSEFTKAGIDCFVLVRTSNPGAGELQDKEIHHRPNGGHEPVWSNVATGVNVYDMGMPRDPGRLGIVAGATQASKLRDIRQTAWRAPFLIPGVGAQGGDLEEVVAVMREHRDPWIVNIGRGIAEASNDRGAWPEAVAKAALSYHDAMVPIVKGE